MMITSQYFLPIIQNYFHYYEVFFVFVCIYIWSWKFCSSIHVKKCVGILMSIVWNQEIAFYRIAIFSIFILMIHHMEKLSTFWYLVCFYPQCFKIFVILDVYLISWVIPRCFIMLMWKVSFHWFLSWFVSSMFQRVYSIFVFYLYSDILLKNFDQL